jgi:hypothetical protein
MWSKEGLASSCEEVKTGDGDRLPAVELMVIYILGIMTGHAAVS